MKTYTAPTDDVARALAALAPGEQTELVVPVPLPESIDPEQYGAASWSEGRKPKYAKPDEWCFIDMAHPIESYPWLETCPYAVGDVVGVKHTWYHYHPSRANPRNEQAWDDITRIARWPTGETVEDVTPNVEAAVWDGPYTVGWEKRIADTMPDWAVIIKPVVVSIACRQDGGGWNWHIAVRKS